LTAETLVDDGPTNYTRGIEPVPGLVRGTPRAAVIVEHDSGTLEISYAP